MNARIPLEEVTNSASSGQDNVLVVSGDLDLARAYTELWLTNGQVVRLPTEVLLTATSPSGELAAGDQRFVPSSESGDTLVVPIVEEQLSVGKRTVATGTVRLQKTVQEYQQALDEPLAIRTFDIERVVLNRPVDTVPEVRHEGDTTIYPLIEERLILTKELILKEEVRVTKRDTERRDTQVVTLRREHMTVERTSTDPDRPQV